MNRHKTRIPAKKSRRFQILSLDGGGIKALFSTAVLAAIEEDLGVRVADHFDLISGTSAGGITAIGLGLGKRPKEILEFYLEHGPNIFPKWFGLKWLQHWFFRKYSSKPLEEALRSCFGDKRFGESSKRLVIPTFNLGENDVYLFRTAHHSRLMRDYKVAAWKVAVATCATPTFFPSFREIDRVRLIDGGVWSNNPIMVGIIEAFGTLSIPLKQIWVLSLGTSEPVAVRSLSLDWGGILTWAAKKAAIDTILRGQSIAAHNQATFLLGKEKIERLNPKVAESEFSVDGVHKADELIGKAAHHSRVAMPLLKDKFFRHKAKNFVPFHS